MGESELIRLSDHLYRVDNGCATYLVIEDGHAIAIDPGRGRWTDLLDSLDVADLEAAFITHHHRDQYPGLNRLAGCEVHAPPFSGTGVRRESLLGTGCPENYDPPLIPIEGGATLQPNGDTYWRDRRIRIISTPGHGSEAVSILMEIDGRSVLFCGDAAHHGGRIFEPFHLETDHWTGAGTLAAWEGIERLRGIHIDIVCPSHGPAISRGIPRTLANLSRRLMRFYRSKGQISSGVPDDYLHTPAVSAATGGARKISPHLYQFGANGYLLTSTGGKGLVIDPTTGDMDALEELCRVLGGVDLTCCTATHYHLDHVDAAPLLRERFGVQVVLHESVAWPLWPPARYELLRTPWLPPAPIEPDEILEGDSELAWEDYSLSIFHAPGQTWWHAGIAATVDDSLVMFSGDSIQPASRWNGTGGFCAYNRSRLRDGFVPTCRRYLRIAPHIVAAGHGTVYRFSAAKMKKIVRWARTAERGILSLRDRSLS